MQFDPSLVSGQLLFRILNISTITHVENDEDIFVDKFLRERVQLGLMESLPSVLCDSLNQAASYWSSIPNHPILVGKCFKDEAGLG